LDWIGLRQQKWTHIQLWVRLYLGLFETYTAYDLGCIRSVLNTIFSPLKKTANSVYKHHYQILSKI